MSIVIKIGERDYKFQALAEAVAARGIYDEGVASNNVLESRMDFAGIPFEVQPKSYFTGSAGW